MSFYENEKLYKTLSDMNVIPEDSLERAYEHSQENDMLLDQVLVEKDLISEENVAKVIADITSFRYVDLSKEAITEDLLSLISEEFAKNKNLIPFKKDNEGVHVAMINPTDEEAVKFVEKKTGEKVTPYFTMSRQLEDALNLYNKNITEAFDEIIEESVSKAKGSNKSEPSIIKIVDTIIQYAYQNKASDIHIEPLDEQSLVRFRIDGIMHDIIELPVDLHDQIVTRIKILSRLRTDEHQAAQDGKITYKLENENLDIRVSIVPVTDGEKIVMRVLSERARQFSLADLGLQGEDLKKVEEAYKKPHGMILSTGPTGSGKTTTLYAILKILNKKEVNIMTIEDPVEYDIDRVNQIQVNEKTGLTFSKGLRSVVRQDPDIILVGEIRDENTANIAINAAMTGHLLLSTLHTNDSATTVPRLLDLGIEPFLISSTINVVIAQRLVRKICTRCRVSVEMKIDDIVKKVPGTKESNLDNKVNEIFSGSGKNGKTHVYEGKGCSVCHNTGYKGRVGLFEVLLIDEQIRDAITNKKNASEIKELAINNGMKTIMQDGLKKVKQGTTTIEEVLRVTKE